MLLSLVSSSVAAILVHLFIDPLPAVLALLGVLDYGITRQQLEDVCQTVERYPHHDKRHDLVDERPAEGSSAAAPMSKKKMDLSHRKRSLQVWHSPVGHDNSSIFLCLKQGIVSVGRIVVGPALQDGKLLFDIPVQG